MVRTTGVCEVENSKAMFTPERIVKTKTPLAHRNYALPEGIDYFEDDMDTVEKVKTIFIQCRTREARIFQQGWQYLVDRFGEETLFEINSRTGWYPCATIAEYRTILRHNTSNIIAQH